MKKFCPKCGKTITKGTFCEECNPEVLEFKPIKIKLCPSYKYSYKGKWTTFKNLKEVTEKVVKEGINKKIKVITGLEQYEDILQKTGIKKDYEITIARKNEEYKIPLHIEVTTSPSYAKVGTSYFEGILQLRAATSEIKEKTKQIIDAMKDVYINKVNEKGDEVDLYFVKKRYISRVADKLVQEFGAYSEQNAQLFTQDSQTSKELHRLNVVVHAPPFTRGDVIEYKDNLLLITGLGKHNTTINLESGKKDTIKYDPKQKHEYHQIKKNKTKIITTHPCAQAISTENYELINLENPLQLKLEKNKNVTIIEHKGRAYIIK